MPATIMLDTSRTFSRVVLVAVVSIVWLTVGCGSDTAPVDGQMDPGAPVDSIRRVDGIEDVDIDESSSHLSRPQLAEPEEGARVENTPVEFRWKQVPGAEIYDFRLYRVGRSDRPQIRRSTSSRTLTVDTMPPAGEYVWRVRAVGGDRKSKWSETRAIEFGDGDTLELRPEKPWTMMYLASWQHDAGTEFSNTGRIATDRIDWEQFSHLIYFALTVSPDGTPAKSLEPVKRNNFSSDRLAAIVAEARRHDTPVLFSVGGGNNYSGFSSAIQPENREKLVETLVDVLRTHRFDGIDLDLEPIHESDFENYRAFVDKLRTKLARVGLAHTDERPLLTVAATTDPRVTEVYADIQESVDQINFMTYDMSGAWSGWQAWHNSPLFSEGVHFDSTGEQMPSVHRTVRRALEAGLKRNRIGFGIDFHGDVWKGVHRLGKWPEWPDAKTSIVETGIRYTELVERYPVDRAQWDSVAETSYLEVESPKAFVSFDNPRSIRRKVEYLETQNLGGIIVWKMAGDFFPDSPQPRTPLMDAAVGALESE